MPRGASHAKEWSELHAYLEGREEKLAWGQLQKPYTLFCNGSFKEHHEVLGEAKTGQN